MADKQKKEPTPPPLLLMPAGGGLTLTPPDQPNVLMPVVQSEPSLFGPDDEGLGEADSFLGQSPPQNIPGQTNMVGQSSSATFFQGSSNNSGSDPFAQINHATPVRPPAGPQMPQTSTPYKMGAPGLAPTTEIPATSAPMAAVAPMPNSGGLKGLYRKHGASRYAQMPAGTYGGSYSSPANLMSSPLAPTPFSPNFTEAATLHQTPFSAANNPPTAPPTLPPQASIGQLPGMGYVPSSVGSYTPVSFHWCFCINIEGRDIWRPFSLADSKAMDEAFKTAAAQRLDKMIVSTDGGRYDVNVVERRRYSIYWEEEPKLVRRCSWFYKREGDNRYVPYAEDFSVRLEEEFQTAVTSGVWHKPIQFDSGETIVMHNPNVVVHYMPSSQPDEWGNVQTDQMRPRVVKRGITDFESIEEGESRQIDHLVFIVHGIGMVCDFRFRSLIECVDDFRSVAQGLIGSHFTQYIERNQIGRVEFLPIQWHTALHSDATGIDSRLKSITLPSTAKLRNFVNDTVMDVLMYTSPTYCQCIIETVGKEMNRLYDLFMTRNPDFKGGVSVAGHSLGSCILFDLLQHQGEQYTEEKRSEETNSQTEAAKAPVLDPEPSEDITDNEKDEEEELASLEDLLAKVGLQEKKKLFDDEQMDLESLIMCEESDLKDLGLPMGPRKKLQGLLKEQQAKKDKQKMLVEKKKKQEEDRKMREKMAAELALKHQEKQQALANGDISVNASNSLTVNFIVGTGGTGQPQILYPQLKFQTVCCFGFGSPVGLFLSARGIEEIGEDFRLPLCPKYFNIFHPFDPVAYRLEPLINPSSNNVKPVLMQHHKGRKRFHLELRENLAKFGTDIKQRIMDSLRSTWNSLHSFARAHQSEEAIAQQVENEMSQVVKDMEDEDRSDTASITSNVEEIYMGQLNEGRRVDYQLQERPIESFNDYMFSLTSHGCYWTSEDTALLVLKEIYALYGLSPTIPGTEGQHQKRAAFLPPPPKGATPPLPMYSSPPPLTSSQSQPSFMSPQGMNMGSPPSGPEQGHSFYQPNMSRPSSVPPSQGVYNSGVPAPSGPPPFSMSQSLKSTNVGPPPMTGFMKKS